jgi:hypothetical protein
MGTGVSTFLETPSSANLRTAVTDETGTGALVFATNPTLEGLTLNNQASMFVRDTDSTVGRIIGSGNIFYVQAGADATDATGHIFMGRYASASPVANITLNGTTTNVAANLVVGGNANVAGTVNTAGQLISTVATGTAPLAVSSTTQVSNLYATRAALADSLIGGTASKGQVVYLSGVNTTSSVTAPTTNMAALLYNTATNAPYWATPSQSLASIMGFTSTATAATTTTLTSSSSSYQYFTGTTTQTVTLPDTSTLALGWTFHIVNNSTGLVTVQTSTGQPLVVIPAGTTSMVTCIDIAGNTTAAWEAGITDFSTYTGSGAVVMNTSPTFTTPNVGAAVGTSLNVTANVNAATMTLTGDTSLGGAASNVRIMGHRVWISQTAPAAGSNVAGDVWITW